MSAARARSDRESSGRSHLTLLGILLGLAIALAAAGASWVVAAFPAPVHEGVRPPGPDSAPPSHAPAEQDFSYRLESDHIVVHTDVVLWPRRIADIAEQTCFELIKLAGVSIPRRKLPIYLIDSASQALALEQRFDIDLFELGGKYSHEARAAFVREHPWSERTISHEMVHWVLSHSIPNCPALIEEGVADRVSERAVVRVIAREIERRTGHRPSLGSLEPPLGGRTCRLRAYLARGERYGLAGLLAMRPFGFRKLGEEAYLFYDLSWCLTRTLERRGQELGAPLGWLLRKLRSSGKDPLVVIESLYRLDAVEQAWLASIAGVAAR